jgi:hypothetical protein
VAEQRPKTRPNGTQLHRELVPLSEATAVTYHIVTQKPEALRDARDLDDVRGLVAIALSTVATILKLENGEPQPLGSAQIAEQLFSGVSGQGDRRIAPDLSQLFVRRGDLVQAIELLKEAHASFGREDLLAALKKR